MSAGDVVTRTGRTNLFFSHGHAYLIEHSHEFDNGLYLHFMDIPGYWEAAKFSAGYQ